MKLKRTLAFLLSAVIMLSLPTAFTSSVYAEIIANTADYYIYSIDEITHTVAITDVKNKKITKAEIPATIEEMPVTTIDTYAFYNCSDLTEIIIPNSVTNIKMSAFFNCKVLARVSISKSVTEIGSYPFRSCPELADISVDAENANYKSIDGVLFDKQGEKLIAFPSGKSGVYQIPNGATEIGGGSFYTAKKVTKVIIPSTLTTVSTNAFVDCQSMTEFEVDSSNSKFSTADGVLFNKGFTKILSVPNGKSGAYTIPNGVTSIGTSAFYYCKKITNVYIPDGVTSIFLYAFNYCSSLESISFTNSVTSITNSVFSNCDALKDVYYVGTPTDWSNIKISTGNEALDGKITYFTFTPPTSLTADGSGKEATVSASTADMGAITVKYYDKNKALVNGLPKNVGTYNVKIDIAASENHSAASDMWVGSFTILSGETEEIDYSNYTYSLDTATNSITITGVKDKTILTKANIP